MGHDPISPISPAQINVQLVPAGAIQVSRYNSFVSRLEREKVVRLGDISPDKRANKNLFSPLAFPSGTILLNWAVSGDREPSVDAFPFEINRKSQIIIGISDGLRIQNATNEGNETELAIDALARRARNDYDELCSSQPSENAYVIYKLLVFDAGRPEANRNNPNVEYVPPPAQSRTTTIKTIVCDILASYLARMEDFARTIQELPAIDSPQALQRERVRQESLADKVRQRMSAAPGQQSRSPASPGLLSRGPSSPGLRSPEDQNRHDATRSRSSFRGESNAASKEQSRDRNSNAMTPSERRKTQAKGRIRVVIGATYLQAGRWPDALKELSEAASIVRMNSDYLWHAKALDLLLVSMIILSWAGMDFSIPSICFPVPEKPQAKPNQGTPSSSATDVGGADEKSHIASQAFSKLLPDLIAYILNIYSKAANFSQETLPQLLTFESILRFGNVLKVLHLRGGTLDQDGLDHIVQGASVTHETEKPIAKRGDLSKPEISSMLCKAIPASASEISLHEAVIIFTGLASIMTVIGMQRKMAFAFRALLSVITPGLVEARKLGAAEMGIHPAAGLSTHISAQTELDRLPFSAKNVHSGLRNLLTALGTVYGIPRPNDKLATDADHIEDIERRNRVAARLQQSGDLALKIEVLECCIDICEALPDFYGVVDYSVRLLRTVRRTNFMPQPYETGCPWMSQDEQVRLSNNIRRTVAAAAKLGILEVEAEYWDDFLVRGVDILETSQAVKLIPHAKKDLEMVESTNDEKRKDPFIFNPFAKTAQDATERLVIAGETVQLRVTLQNPFDVSVEIDIIKLWTEGCDFDAYPQACLVEPYCVQDIVLEGRPLKAGQLQFRGCVAQIRCCRERRFPIFTTEWTPAEDVQMKQTGLDAMELDKARPTSSTSTRAKKTTPKRLEADMLAVTVMEPQPVIEVKSSSLPLAAVMVLEGETRIFELLLTNTSKAPADLFLVTLQDSTTKQIQTALSNKEITPADLYEYQLQLTERPVFRWLRNAEDDTIQAVAPGESRSLTIEIYGRPGLTDGSVQIDYAYLGIPQSAIQGQFYTRKFVFPVTITVNAGAEVPRCNLLPFSSDFAWSNLNGNDKKQFIEDDKTPTALTPSLHRTGDQFNTLLSRLGTAPYGTDHCLLLLDLRNVWPQPLTITIQVLQSPPTTPSSWDHAVYTAHETLQPGHTSRIVLLVPRLHIPNPYKPIPTIGDSRRQFVVSNSQTSAEAELAAREVFWFREGLLNLLRGSWAEFASESSSLMGRPTRTGDIDLRRGIRLTPRTIDALRIEDVEVSYDLVPSPPSSFTNKNKITRLSPTSFSLSSNTFATLKVTITNRSPSPLHLVARLQPSLRHQQPYSVALDLSKRFVWSGVLQRVVRPGPVEGGGKRDIELGICALGRGEFEVGCSVEEVVRRDQVRANGNGNGDGGRGPSGEGKQRRIWHAKESCIIIARDGEENEDE